MTQPKSKSGAGGKCPICSRPADAKYRPFCSRRCADVDLSRWLRGAYAVPGRLDADEDGDDTAAGAGTVRESRRDDSAEGEESDLD